MPISVACAQAHVDLWTKKLARSPTSNWPANLFHAAQLEAAVEIIRSGRIICREDQPTILCDVANQGALLNNPIAHKYARLYFRPRNSYHLKTEGIKSDTDPNRIDPHMAVPIMFVFDLVKTMTTKDAYFTRGNFATSHAKALSGDSEFNKLDFELIYHDSAPGNRMSEIHNWRMSEVVVPGYLDLDTLKTVVCRTPHEERMLRYRLSEEGIIQSPMKVEQRGSVFLRKAMFIDEIYLIDGVLTMNFHAPVSYPKDKYCVLIEVTTKDVCMQETYHVSNGKWSFPNLPTTGPAVWRVTIEGCLAYEGPVPSATGVF